MLKLRTGLTSPFGRKARIAIAVLGLERAVTLDPTSGQDPADPVSRLNPLGKVPVLVLDDGSPLYDSPVILDYLDHHAGGGIIVPKEPKARFAALRLQALADGIMDASILIIYEARYRSADKHEPKWLDHQAGKIARALAALDAAPPALTSPPDVGQITLACALGYRDSRFEGRWRADHPRLVAWLDGFAKHVPAFDATKPPV